MAGNQLLRAPPIGGIFHEATVQKGGRGEVADELHPVMIHLRLWGEIGDQEYLDARIPLQEHEA
jgi:hypothetical protein